MFFSLHDSHMHLNNLAYDVFNIIIIPAIKELIYMVINIFNNERMKPTDLVQSCSSADVTWAWVGGS